MVIKMNHMEFSIALPPLIELTNAGIEWNTMKQRLQAHLKPNASSASQYHSSELQQPFLISIAAEQVQKIFNMYDVSYDEAVKFNKILQKIEDLCLPQFLIIYNRFRFFTCKQNGPEFNSFLQQLLVWSDLCEFGDLKDILLKDCIISGISEESIRQHLLRTEQLDFDKTVDICRTGFAKEYGTDDFRPQNKIIVDSCTNTCSIEELVKSNHNNAGLLFTNVATNTYLETNEQAIQTVSSICFDHPAENMMMMPSMIELKSLDLDDHCNQGLPDTSYLFHESFLPQAPISSQVTESEYKSCNDLPTISDTFEHMSADCSEIVSFRGPSIAKTDKPAMINNFHNKNIDNSLEEFSKNGAVSGEFANRITGTELLNLNGNGINGQLSSEILLENDDPANVQIVEEGLKSTGCDSKSTMADTTSKNRLSKLTCNLCKITFKDFLSLNKHKRTHEGEKRFRCDVCPSRFFNASHLKVHKRLHTGVRPFVCNTCGKSYVEASKLKAHSRKHTGEKPYKCDVCPMTFAWSAALNRHKRTHTGEKPYACEYCRRAFFDFTALQRHIRTHTKEKPYKCELCPRSFCDPSALRAHKRIHTGERPYNCKFCNLSFTRSQHLKEHIKLHFDDKPFKCQTCGACFVGAYKLKSHMLRHTGERPYHCEICAATFVWAAAYRRHLRTHTFEKPYTCNVCGNSFGDATTLNRHHRTHTGERPYPCDLCESRFADSSSLSRHKKIHTGEKAFTCDICDASFAMKYYLSRHVRIHTKEKPYSCDKCDSKFVDSSKLKRHQKVHERTQLKLEQQQELHQHQPQHQQQLQQLQQQQELQQQLQQQKHHMLTTSSNMSPDHHLLPHTPLPPPPFIYQTLNINVRQPEMPHYPDDEILSHLSKTCTFDHQSKTDQSDHHFDHSLHPMTIHGHDHDAHDGLVLSFGHPHEESLDLATSGSTPFGIAPGMESLANILSFDA